MMKIPGAIFFLMWSVFAFGQGRTTVPMILDADTGNEVDDLFAVSRALIEPSWNMLALNAAQWQTSLWAIDQTMENSHRLNNVLLGELDLSVKTRRGAVNRMFDWGDQAQHSAAAYEIIKQAHAMSEGEKLTVVALGALTNVASAIFIDSTIENKIKLYWLGTNLYPEQDNLITITDFNCVMDIQALHILFNSSVEMHVMPHTLGFGMDFNYAYTENQLRGVHTLGDYLCDRWYNHLDGLRKERWIWDLALIEAMIHPEWAEEALLTTPAHLGNREVYYYRSIDGEKMKAEFFETLLAYLKKE